MDEIRITAEPKDNDTCRFIVDRPVYPDGSIFLRRQRARRKLGARTEDSSRSTACGPC